MNVPLPNLASSVGDTSSRVVPDEPATLQQTTRALPKGGLLMAPGRLRSVVATNGGGGYPMRLTPPLQTFLNNAVDDLQFAQQVGNRYPLLAPPPGAAGRSIPIWSGAPGESATVLLPVGADLSLATTTPDIADDVHAAFEFFGDRYAQAFSRLAPAGREFARSAVLRLLEDVKHGGGLEARDIPVALRMIATVARTWPASGPPTSSAPTSTATTPRPTRAPQPESARDRLAAQAGLMLTAYNARPDNRAGSLDAQTWRDMRAIENSELRRQVVRQAFQQFRALQQHAFDGDDWPATPMAVLRPEIDWRLIEATHTTATLSDEATLSRWQSRVMLEVAARQYQIERGMNGDGTPLSADERADFRQSIEQAKEQVQRGPRLLRGIGSQHAPMIDHAIRQWNRLLQQLDPDGQAQAGPVRTGETA